MSSTASSDLSIAGQRRGGDDRCMEDKGQLAYSIDHFAAVCDLSDWTIREAIRRGELVPKFPGKKKALILREEGERWLQSLPDEPRCL